MKKVLGVAVAWIVCGYGAWGMTLGYLSHKFPEQPNVTTAGVMAAGGPFGLIASLVVPDRYHWRVSPMTTEERWQAYHEKWPSLSRASFERDFN